MKIALALCGQPRHFNKGYEFIKKHIINPNLERNLQIDVFLHFWFNEQDINKDRYSYISDTSKINNYSNDIITKDTPENIISLYKPKYVEYEEQVDCNYLIKPEYNNRRNLCSPFATISQYLSFNKVINLVSKYEKEKCISYNLIFKCRYDTELDSNIILSNIDKTYIYFNEDIKNDNNNVYVNDGIFFGNNNNMKKISNAYLDFDKYWNNGTIWGNEILLGEFIKNNNILYKKINFGKITWIRN